MFTSRMRREARALAAEMRQKAQLEATKARIESQDVRAFAEKAAQYAHLRADKARIEALKGLGVNLLRDENTPEYNLCLDYRKFHNPNMLVPDITWEMYDYMTPDEKILLAPDVPRYAMEVPEKKFKEVISNQTKGKPSDEENLQIHKVFT